MSDVSSAELWENRGRIFGAALLTGGTAEPQVGVVELVKAAVRSNPVTEKARRGRKVKTVSAKTRKLAAAVESLGEQGPCSCPDLDTSDPLAWCQRCGY